MKGRLLSLRALGRLFPYGLVTLFYLLLSLEVRTRTVSADWPFFMQVLNQTLHGNPFTIYANRTFDIHTFAYGPVSLLLMAPFKLASEAVGAPEPLERWIVWLPFFFADALAGLLVCRVVRRSPLATPGMLAFVYALYLLSWPVFFGSPVHSHFESVVLAFLLLGLMSTEKQQYLVGGVLCGLAMLTKQTAIVVVIPQLFILWRAVGWRAALRFGGAVAVTGLVVMAPYLVADPADVWYMAFTLPGELAVAYQSTLIAWKAFPDVYTFLVAYADTIILVLVVLASLVAVLTRRIVPRSSLAYGLYGLCALIMVDFEKWGYVHYFVLPFVMLVIWELLAGRWPWAGLTLAAGVTAMYILDADVGTSISFSFLIAPLVVLLAGLTLYVLYYVFRPAGTS
jgi:Gpi18-like mannosyltransferase